GAFVANIHTDVAASAASEAIVASAQARGVPIISAKQLLEWEGGRDRSSFSEFGWSGDTLSFNVVAGDGANGLQAMVPLDSGHGTVTVVTRDGSFVPFTTDTIKGIEYAIFPAVSGRYALTVDSSTVPHLSSTSPADAQTGVATTTAVRATFSKALDPATVTGLTFWLTRPDGTTVPAAVSYESATRTAVLTPTA